MGQTFSERPVAGAFLLVRDQGLLESRAPVRVHVHLPETSRHLFLDLFGVQGGPMAAFALPDSVLA